jgi:plastocyanin
MMGSAVTAFLPAMPAADAAVTEQATIANFSFSPNPVTIPLGATLQWTNTDGTAHTVTADDGSFSSGSLAKNATFSHTFDQPGPVAYHCAIHSSMRGTVQVEAPPTTAAPTTTTTAAPTTSTTAAPTTTTTAASSPPTAGLASPKPTSPKPAVSSTTRATAAPTTATTAPTTSTTAPAETTTTLPEQVAPPTQTAPPTQEALDTPSGESGNGGAVGVGVAVAAVLLLGGGGWWVWRRRVSAG